MASFVLFMIFIGILVFAVSIAISIYMAGEKGLSLKYGILFGMIPFIGQIALALMPSDDSKVVEEMYQRNLLNYDDYEKTMDVVVKRTQEMKVTKK